LSQEKYGFSVLVIILCRYYGFGAMKIAFYGFFYICAVKDLQTTRLP